MDHKLWVAWRAISFLFHLIMLLVYVYGVIIGELTYLDEIKGTNEIPWMRGWKFMHRWTVVSHIVIWSTSVVNDIIVGQKLYDMIKQGRTGSLAAAKSLSKTEEVEKLQKFIDLMVFSVGFPIGMFSTFAFWIFYMMGPNTILNRPATDPVAIHLQTTILGPAMTYEILCTSHKRPLSHAKPLKIITLFFISFASWVFFVAWYKNFWLYPILADLGIVARCSLMLGCYFLCFVTYFIGIGMHELLWPPARTNSFESIPKHLVANSSGLG